MEALQLTATLSAGIVRMEGRGYIASTTVTDSLLPTQGPVIIDPTCRYVPTLKLCAIHPGPLSSVEANVTLYAIVTFVVGVRATIRTDGGSESGTGTIERPGVDQDGWQKEVREY
jgi:hypothetical protein